jgi:hypothetical protein
MAGSPVSLAELLKVAHSLSPLEKLELIERLVPDLEPLLQQAQSTTAVVRRRGLRGILAGCAITERDIDEARRDLWGSFPREGF